MWAQRCQAVEAAQRAAAHALPARGEVVAGDVRQGDWMGVAMEGAMVHIRGEGWEEPKVGSVFDMEVRPTFDPKTHEVFGQARETHVLGEGSVWAWKLVEHHVYDGVQVVDWHHAAEHLAETAGLLEGEGTPAARTGYQAREEPLYEGHAYAMAQEVIEKAKRKVAADLRREAGYFQTH